MIGLIVIQVLQVVVGGNHVLINYSNGISIMYAHLYPNSIRVKPGDIVDYGQVIGNIGNTGNSYGEHLHISVKVNGSYSGVDSSKYINPDNPRPYKYLVEVKSIK